MHRSCLLLLLALAACGGHKDDRPDPRPDWRNAKVDGIAPLMTVQSVTSALSLRGYRQVSCGPGRPVRADVLERGDDSGCFVSPRRPMLARLHFQDLKEGRRLAVVNFEDRHLNDKSPQAQIDAGKALAKRLRAHLGKTLTTAQNPGFVTLYWGRPGGSPSLPDLVSTTVGENFGANIAMTSFWAYGQQREASSAQ